MKLYLLVNLLCISAYDLEDLLEIMECARTFPGVNVETSCFKNFKAINKKVASVSRPILSQVLYGYKTPPSCELGCHREDHFIDLVELEKLTGWSYVPSKRRPFKKFMNIGRCRGSCAIGIRRHATCSHIGGEALFQNRNGERFVIEGFFADFCVCAYAAKDNCYQPL